MELDWSYFWSLFSMGIFWRACVCDGGGARVVVLDAGYGAGLAYPSPSGSTVTAPGVIA